MSQFKNRRPAFYFPLFISITLIAGFWIGSFLQTSRENSSLFPQGFNEKNKFNEILNYIEEEYVDTIDKSRLSETAIEELLLTLDPHSVYIPSEDLQAMNEPLEGNFGGIGIEFSINDDTIMVVSPVSGGPSELLGIMAGDRIVKIEGKTVAGIRISNKDVTSKLRGKSGSMVKISISRKGERGLLDFAITRGDIPIHSVDVEYMLDNNTGYVKVNKFSANTYDEFLNSIKKLKKLGVEDLVLDLRGNGGGYLNAATMLADEFLEKDKLIVYTEGRSRPKQYSYATSKGALEKMPVVILIDEGSASASEIVAGAIQDNDRGTIIGRRSFGKGLVQESSTWPDGSAIRLTVARYYTPTGRSIQTPYNEGSREYYSKFYDRFRNGELEKEDSMAINKDLKFTTPKGKIVYGGGGIMPDLFVPYDTSGNSPYLIELGMRNILNDFAFNYADENRKNLSMKGLNNYIKDFEIPGNILKDLIDFASGKGLTRNPSQLRKSENEIKVRLKASIARQVWKNPGFYPVLNSDDPVIVKAIDVLNKD